LYAAWKKQSLRLYLDVGAPGAMWGLAFGRVGCFFNGCCFGGPCTLPPTYEPRYEWAVHFPFASPAHMRQWEERQLTVPAELITATEGDLQPWLVPGSLLSMSVEKREAWRRQVDQAREAYTKAKVESPNAEATKRLEAALKAALKDNDHELRSLNIAQKFPSRREPARATSVSELELLAAGCASLPVHPTQLYAAISAMLLSGFLSALFYVRKRHGVVIGVLGMLYPIQRALEELIRVDNPHDTAGLTVSQFISLGLFVSAVVYLIVLYRSYPERSRYAVAAASVGGPSL